MKDNLLKVVRAFIALLHTDADNVAQIAALKKQIADAQAPFSLTDAEQAEVNAAANQIGATEPPTPVDIKPVAAVPPLASPDPAAVAAATAAVPAAVTAAAAVPPKA